MDEKGMAAAWTFGEKRRQLSDRVKTQAAKNLTQEVEEMSKCLGRDTR